MTERKIKCRQCGKETVFSPKNPFRPFCSHRCRLLDLGEWASGTYKVPSEEPTSIQDLDDLAATDSLVKNDEDSTD